MHSPVAVTTRMGLSGISARSSTALEEGAAWVAALSALRASAAVASACSFNVSPMCAFTFTNSGMGEAGRASASDEIRGRCEERGDAELSGARERENKTDRSFERRRGQCALVCLALCQPPGCSIEVRRLPKPGPRSWSQHRQWLQPQRSQGLLQLRALWCGGLEESRRVLCQPPACQRRGQQQTQTLLRPGDAGELGEAHQVQALNEAGHAEVAQAGPRWSSLHRLVLRTTSAHARPGITPTQTLKYPQAPPASQSLRRRSL